MTEAEWLTCDNLTLMLRQLGGRGSPRKLRLFACACCRRFWHQRLNDRCQQAVAVAEQFADGLATREDLRRVSDAMAVVFKATQPTYSYDPSDALMAAARIREEIVNAIFPDGIHSRDDYFAASSLQSDESTAQAAVLRDIMGNPFQPLPSINPAWLAWNDGTIRKMAQIIYDERRFKDMPILADALEDAGCDHPDILSHCRQPGEHARGCWLVDCLLGKE